MGSAVFAFMYAILTFVLAGEAQSDWLRILGFAAGSWMAFAGAITGWQAARAL